MENCRWNTPDTFPILADDEIHVWCASLLQPPGVFDKLQGVLSPEERKRAAQFIFEKDRNASIVARGLLRTLLGAYLETDPATLRFTAIGNDKPALPPMPGRRPLYFNTSHSGNMVLYGFTRLGEIGVDTEQKRPLEDALGIAESYFSQSEKIALRALPDRLKSDGFFNCWSRKEAFIKTYGKGLSLALDSFDVSLAPHEEARLLSIDGSPEKAGHWTLGELTPAPDYAAAFCIEAKPNRVSCFSWNSSSATFFGNYWK